MLNKERREEMKNEEKENQKEIINLRSSSKNVSAYQIQSMPYMSIREREGWGFYGHCIIDHEYEAKSINGDNVVVDHATSLMWHYSGGRGGSLLPWSQLKAEKWMENFKKSGYAGYYDWRLPTLEEASSLLKKSESNWRGDLCIDTVFDKKIKSMITSDKYINNSYSLCGIDLIRGSVIYAEIEVYNHLTWGCMVRPVRTVETVTQESTTTPEDWFKRAQVHHNNESKGLVAVAMHNKDEYAKSIIQIRDSVIKFLDKALELDPVYAPAWFAKGEVHLIAGNLDEAIACLDKSLDINPNLVDAIYCKAKTLGMKGSYDEALSTYERVIEKEPNDAEAWMGKAHILRQKKLEGEATACTNKAKSLDPTFSQGFRLESFRWLRYKP